MNELKPCPFCGSEAEAIKAHHIFENPYVVICNNEKCRASLGMFSKTREEAIESWNRRAADGTETKQGWIRLENKKPPMKEIEDKDGKRLVSDELIVFHNGITAIGTIEDLGNGLVFFGEDEDADFHYWAHVERLGVTHWMPYPQKPEKRNYIRPDDTVLHKPSGERWVVCGIDYDAGELIPCGWPFPTLAKIEDCELIKEGVLYNGVPECYTKALKENGLDRFIDRRAADGKH